MHRLSVRSFACAVAFLFASLTTSPPPRRSPESSSIRRARRCRACWSRWSMPPAATVDSTFTYPDGTFRLGVGRAGRMPRRRSRSRAFKTSTATAAQRSSGSTLTVAPIQEAVVVSATRTEAPLAQLASSATVVRRRGDRAASESAADRSAAQRAGCGRRRQRQPRRRRVALPARRREQLHEGPARRHSAERAGRHVQLRQRDAPRTWSASRSSAARSRRCSGRTRCRASSSCSRRRGVRTRRARRCGDRRRQLRQPRASRPTRPARPATSTTPSAQRTTCTDNEGPNNEFDNTTLSGIRGLSH